MADKIIRIKLDVMKIDKARLFKGDKGTYLDATILWNDEQDQYNNNGMIVQDVSKAEREAGIKGNILGNVKLVEVKPKAAPGPQDTSSSEPYSQGLPF